MPNLYGCTGSSSCGNKVIYLGQGTSFNIKEVAPDIDHTVLTSDNFIVEVLGWPRTTSSSSSGEISSYVDAIMNANNIEKIYNNNSGILTINNAFAKATGKSRGASTTTTSNLNIHVYLVTGEIEKQ